MNFHSGGYGQKCWVSLGEFSFDTGLTIYESDTHIHTHTTHVVVSEHQVDNGYICTDTDRHQNKLHKHSKPSLIKLGKCGTGIFECY